MLTYLNFLQEVYDTCMYTYMVVILWGGGGKNLHSSTYIQVSLCKLYLLLRRLNEMEFKMVCTAVAI